MTLTPDALKALQRGIQAKLIVGYGQAPGKTILLPRQIAEKRLPALNALVGKVNELVDGQVKVGKVPYQGFGFLGTTLRAGPSIRRGGSGGDPGTLGLPLKDGINGRFFLAAGHVLSAYWSVSNGPIDRFIANNQTTSLGQIKNISPVKPSTPLKSPKNQLDAGIIEAEPDIDAVDVTTCGFPVGPEVSVGKGDEVEKCGFSTGHRSAQVIPLVGGIGVEHLGKVYFFDQVIRLTDLPGSTFASQGDSGAVVVKKAGGGFVGMLFAADLGAKEYLVAPAKILRAYWESFGLTRL